ncbi:MAG: hypothetical protein HS115_17190 [Spirochaetales bacterium]|nr:hypothetical protein [Spirochaetales bacterium]
MDRDYVTLAPAGPVRKSNFFDSDYRQPPPVSNKGKIFVKQMDNRLLSGQVPNR